MLTLHGMTVTLEEGTLEQAEVIIMSEPHMRRRWRKLHLGLDVGGWIYASKITDEDVNRDI